MLVANSTLKEVVHGMSCLSLIPRDKSCLHKASEQGGTSWPGTLSGDTVT